MRLSHYIHFLSPGRYRLRLALRKDGFWDHEENARQLPRGVLFLYSKWFVLDVARGVHGRGDV